MIILIGKLKELNRRGMKNKIDKTLIDKLTILARQEKKLKAFKSRLRVRGKIIGKSISKKGHLKLIVKKGKDEYPFTILKTHKEKFALAKRIPLKTSISIEGIPRFRFIICTRLKTLKKGIDESKQTRIDHYSPHQSKENNNTNNQE